MDPTARPSPTNTPDSASPPAAGKKPKVANSKPPASRLDPLIKRARRAIETAKAEEHAKARAEIDALMAELGDAADAATRAPLADLEKLEAQANAATSDIALQLEKELAARGERLSGQLPTLRFPPFTLELSPDRKKVDLWYGPDLVRRGIAFLPSAIIDAKEAFQRDLSERSLAPKLLWEYISASYRRAVVSAPPTGGDAIPLLDILRDVAMLSQTDAFRKNPTRENYTAYPRWQFGHDLQRLQESKELDVHGRLRLHSSTPAQEKRGEYIWVPESAEGARYSQLSIREANP